MVIWSAQCAFPKSNILEITALRAQTQTNEIFKSLKVKALLRKAFTFRL